MCTSLSRLVERLVRHDQMKEGWRGDEDLGLLAHDGTLPLDGHIDRGHRAAGHNGNLQHHPPHHQGLNVALRYNNDALRYILLTDAPTPTPVPGRRPHTGLMSWYNLTHITTTYHVTQHDVTLKSQGTPNIVVTLKLGYLCVSGYITVVSRGSRGGSRLLMMNGTLDKTLLR